MGIWTHALIAFFIHSPMSKPQGWGHVYQATKPSVFLVECGTRKGAGFLFRDQNHVISSLQVAGCGRKIWLSLPNQTQRIQAQLQSYLSKYDLALLKLKRPIKKRQPLRPAKYRRVEIGQKVAVIGHPYKTDGPLDRWTRRVLSWSLAAGVIGRVANDSLQVNMPLMTGFAGSPLLDQQGRVLGLLTTRGPKGEPIGVAVRTVLFQRLFQPNAPRIGWPFLSFGFQLHARFSYALGDRQRTRIAPSSQEVKLDVIFADQLLLGLSAGFDLLSLNTDFDLSLLFGAELDYRFLMARTMRPYLNYVAIGVGVVAMQLKIFVPGQNQQQGRNNESRFLGDLKFTLWSGLRFFSMVGQFSIGVYFDVEDVKNPVLSVSWGFGSS